MSSLPSQPYESGFKTRQQMAGEYSLTVKPWIKKVKDAGIHLPKGRISPRWQKRIYEALGYPPGISKKDFEDT